MIIKEFKKFKERYKDNAFLKLNEFFKNEEKKFYKKKINELMLKGHTEQEATIKARQGWVSTIGRNLEKVIKLLIEDFCKQNNLYITNDKILKKRNLSKELQEVKRALLVDFGEYALLPDGDIIIYHYKQNRPKILAILSIKNSFRERYTETPYWKLKLLQSEITQHIKVFMITPDKDNEISSSERPRKSRIIMEYELDGIYLAKNNFDGSQKIKSITELINDLKELL
jgi:type II restriction enzyme